MKAGAKNVIKKKLIVKKNIKIKEKNINLHRRTYI